MQRTEPLRAALVACSVLLGACSTAVPVRPPGAPTGQAPSVRHVIAVLESRDEALSPFRAEARLDYRSPEQSFRSTQVVVVRAPSSARIDVRNPFGISYSVATDGRSLAAFDRRQNVFHRGDATPESFRRFLGIPLGANEMAAILRGFPPALGESRWNPLQATPGGWHMQRRLSGGGTQNVTLSAQTLLPMRVEIAGDRVRRDVVVEFEDYRDVRGVPVPHRTRATFRDGTVVELVYRSVERQASVPEDAFRLVPPTGAKVLDIEEEAAGDAEGEDAP